MSKRNRLLMFLDFCPLVLIGTLIMIHIQTGEFGWGLIPSSGNVLYYLALLNKLVTLCSILLQGSPSWCPLSMDLTHIERRVLWRELQSVQQLVGDGVAWCLSEDFNACLGPGETNNGTQWTTGMTEF